LSDEKVSHKGKSELGQTLWRPPQYADFFDEMVRQLKSSEKEYRSSIPLKKWAQKNKDSKYVPQELLEAWDIEVTV